MKRTSREAALLTITCRWGSCPRRGIARLQHRSVRPGHAMNGGHHDVS
jgi:hypothetical protein